MLRTTVMIAVVLFAAIAQGAAELPARFKRLDKNGDGKLSSNEWPGSKRMFDRADRNGDGFITGDEIFTRGPRKAPMPDGAETMKDVVYGKGGEVDLKMDIYRLKPKDGKPQPVVVFIHGGGWRSGDKDLPAQHAPEFLNAGFVYASINYRLTDVAIFPAQIHDCKCAIRFLRANAEKYGIDPDRIGVWGSSAGGHLVAMLGTSGGEKALEGEGGCADQSSSVQAVCDWYGPSDLTTLQADRGRGPNISAESALLGGPLKEKIDLARQASPISYVDKTDPPFLIMQGTKDPVVPAVQSDRLHKALVAAGVDSTYVPLEGASHGGPEFLARRPDVLAFFTRVLKAADKP